MQWTYFEITWQHGIPSQSCTKITANDIFLCLWFHDVNQIRRPMYSFPSVQMAIHPIDLHAHSLRQDFLSLWEFPRITQSERRCYEDLKKASRLCCMPGNNRAVDLSQPKKMSEMESWRPSKVDDKYDATFALWHQAGREPGFSRCHAQFQKSFFSTE